MRCGAAGSVTVHSVEAGVVGEQQIYRCSNSPAESRPDRAKGRPAIDNNRQSRCRYAQQGPRPGGQPVDGVVRLGGATCRHLEAVLLVGELVEPYINPGCLCTG